MIVMEIMIMTDTIMIGHAVKTRSVDFGIENFQRPKFDSVNIDRSPENLIALEILAIDIYLYW
jgi:hypothetical protein